MLTTIPFSGFYGSQHEAELDQEVENLVSNSSGNGAVSDKLAEMIWDGIVWRVAMNNYAKQYAATFAHFFAMEYEGIALEYESMSSPHEYNFTTDRIFCTISLLDIQKLTGLVTRERFEQTAKELFTSYDGFISHYSSNVESWGEPDAWDHNQVGTLVLAAVQQVEERDGERFEDKLLENMSESNDASDAVDAALNEKGKRIAKIASYLREREERKYWR